MIAMLGGCIPHRGHAAPQPGDDITLYRDWALVRHRTELDVPAGRSSRRLRVAAGIAADRIVLVDRGGLAIPALHVRADDPDDPERSGELALDVVAPHAGRYSIEVAYATDRLRWDAAYSLATTPARDRALLRGAIAIRDTAGVVFRGAIVRVIDAELGAWRGKTGEQLANALVGAPTGSTGPAQARELGRVDLELGETRLELLADARPRAMTAVFVFDPIGTALDRASSIPAVEPDLGVDPPPATTLVESFAIARDDRTSATLPAGPVHLFERRDDGSLAVLGAARIFDAGTRVASSDTVAAGVADGVTGHRERRELTSIDGKLVEEFAIAIENARATAVDVVVREHLYRGQTWALGYYSAPAVQEGPQQFTMTTRVPAHGRSELFYVVVYCGGGDDCEADGTHRPVR
jgi:hypothetical protein